MTDFLLVLTKINLAISVAILIVALLRRPLRAAFHASVAYALWLLVPAAALASLLPPRVISVAVHPVHLPIAIVAGHVPQTQLSAPASAFDGTSLLFAAWAVGAAAMLFAMARAQLRFRKAERRGAAGPAVVGFLRPRIVIPAGFSAEFSAAEQTAILAHERAHLARQDARINAAMALLRCLCWFNPLVHIGAMWLRRDQELACDAAALRHVPRIDYANALLKSQMRPMALPLGCAWPGAEHPLTERVRLLKAPLPGRARRVAGMGTVLVLTLFAGLGAWAAQPAQSGPAPHNGFTGKFFYTQKAGDGGASFLLTLESNQADEFTMGAEKSTTAQRNHIVMHFPFGMAQADDAKLDFRNDTNLADHKSITLKGHVRVVSGPDIIHGGQQGETLVFDARTGLLTLDGKTMPSGMPNYVYEPCAEACTR
jgi:beta-lactamase regulating signal transducer with metallopeptidase domain